MEKQNEKSPIASDTSRVRAKGTVGASEIEPGLPVVCSKGGQFAVVDHMEGAEVIKLNKDKAGVHHYIPLAWVTHVDDKVHVDRPGEQAMKEWSTLPPRAS